MTTKTAQKFLELERTLGDFIFERYEETHTSLLALAVGEHHVQIGEPGIAKSFLVEQICKRIDGMEPKDYFHKLLTRQMSEDKLMGPVDLAEMQVVVIDGKRTGGVIRRNVSRHLPSASIAFLDEIFKATSLLNTLLNALNERIYDDEVEGVVDIPLISCFAASNEFPEEGSLNALWDRFLFRMIVERLKDDSNMESLLRLQLDDNPTKVLSLDDIRTAAQEVNDIEIPDLLVKEIVSLRRDLAAKGIIPSDRRWRQAVKVIKAEAWMDGCTTAAVKHMAPLVHVLWDDVEQIREVKMTIMDLADPVQRMLDGYVADLTQIFDQLKQIHDEDHARTVKVRATFEAHSDASKLCKEVDALRQSVEGESCTALLNRFDRINREFNKYMDERV